MTSIKFVWLLVACISCARGKAVDHGMRVSCYIASWGIIHGGIIKFEPRNAEPGIDYCTHLMYMYATLNENTSKIQIRNGGLDIGRGGIVNTVALKKINPRLKVMVVLGGWDEGSVKYSKMARKKETRKIFVESVEQYLDEYGFDGLNIMWQYPAERGGILEDKDNLILLLKDLRKALTKRGKLLVASISSFPWRIKLGIKGKEMAENVDFIEVLTQYYHGGWSSNIAPGSPLYATDGMSINDTINSLLSMGIDPGKLNYVISNYVSVYRAAEPIPPEQNNITNLSINGTYTSAFVKPAESHIPYIEFCTETEREKDSWRFVPDELSQTTYAVKVNGDKVYSFDTPENIAAKVKYGIEKKLGGIIMYAFDKDDFRGICASSQGEKFANLKRIDKLLNEFSNNRYDDLYPLLQEHGAHHFWNGAQ